MLRSPEGDGRAAAVAGGEADGRARREGNGRRGARRRGGGLGRRGARRPPMAAGEEDDGAGGRESLRRGSGEIESNRFSV